MGEFDLIRRFFSRPVTRAVLGGGDDCALIAPNPDCDLAISSDMLVAGRHFLVETDAARLGWKSLAVNLSDLAACSARPLACTLALALPAVREDWLAAFAAGLYDCADRYDCELIGGDTTRGPLTISISVFGEVPRGSAIRRSGASPGDSIWVSGLLGQATAGLKLAQGQLELPEDAARAALAALERPVPRVELGIALRGLASAMIDVSDGLAADLGHILFASHAGAVLDVDALPRFAGMELLASDEQLTCLLTGGDDYELCFTSRPDHDARVFAAARGAGVPVTRIGRINADSGLKLVGGDQREFALPPGFSLKGFDHFG